ncbi:hypothetical protein RhiirA4_438763 [Rhizophagus irregularis]|uniref:F-box domain-containing protein n=1 Tax=Rhizophagus irregularis TaxID=588596 RepID=A0A2I1FT98_9GLOM|nr:hypothetical protein RhiirA4_438763 [Rhizophagus irregularis]
MPCQLPTDCLNEIFEYLEEDKITLRSCLLVNRLWCEIAVRILWRNVWSFQYSVNYNPYRTHVPLAIIEEEIGTLKLILNNCQYLETINIWCGDGYLNEKEFLEIFAKHSPKNFYELEIFYAYKARSKISFEDLEKFFINWKNRLSQKPLSLIVIKSYDCISLELKVENMKIIERYIKMGVIKKFKTKKFEED